MKKKEVKTYIGRICDNDVDFKTPKYYDIELSDVQLLYLRSYVSGLHPVEIGKKLCLSNQKLLALKNGIKEIIFASNDFEMVQRAFLFKLIDRGEFMENSLKDIALKKAALVVSEEIFFNAKGIDRVSVIYNLLLSFYGEMEYEHLLLKLKIQ